MIENSIVYRDFKGKYEYLPISRAKGSEIWDREGKRYIDFTSGWNVTNLGWNDPEVAEALIAQTRKNAQGLLWGSDPIQEEYAAALTAAFPRGLDACAKETSGTESVEVAIKVARAYTGRKHVIGFEANYHGQLFASLALGASESARQAIAPLVPDITPYKWPTEQASPEEFDAFVSSLDQSLAKETIAAIVVEPEITTGWGSTLVSYPGSLKKIRELTAKYGTLLIVDEVGTGFSRTGKLFGIQHEEVIPDLVALAKGISNGVAAIGTVVGRSEIFQKAFSEAFLISTFGWTPVACAAALKTLQIHQRDRIWELADQKGAYAMSRLGQIIGDKVTGVVGRGMEIGLRFRDAETCASVRKGAFADGLHVVVGSAHNMQIMPPLTISQDLLDEGLDILMKHAR